ERERLLRGLLTDRGRRYVRHQHLAVERVYEPTLNSNTDRVDETTRGAAGDRAGRQRSGFRRCAGREAGGGCEVAVWLADDLNPRTTAEICDAGAGYGDRTAGQGHRTRRIAVRYRDG